MAFQVKSYKIELDSNPDPCQAYSEIMDLEFHSRSKKSFGNFLMETIFFRKFQKGYGVLTACKLLFIKRNILGDPHLKEGNKAVSRSTSHCFGNYGL